MNKVIALPKGEFVLVPKQEYKRLLRKQQIPIVKLTPAEKRAIAKSEQEFARGDYVTLDELEHELGGAHRKRR